MFQVDEFKPIIAEIRSEYPNVEAMHRFEAVFGLKAGEPVSASRSEGAIGFKCSSADNRQIAQFRKDGVTLNRLDPYSSWEALKPEALRLWSLYAKVARPREVQRIALRYINKISLQPRAELKTVLSVTPPRIPGAPESIWDYVLRVRTHGADSGITANVIQSLERATAEASPTLVLDIDVFLGSPSSTDVNAIGTILDKLRIMKNEIFFGMITESFAATLA